MEKVIFLTPEQAKNLDWNLSNEDCNSNLGIHINTAPERRTIKLYGRASNGERFDTMATFEDYRGTIEQLYDEDLLPCGIIGGNSVICNDHNNQVSSHVFHGEISEIIGDTFWAELMLYSSFDELNADLSGVSFSHQDNAPEYEINQQ